MCDVLLRLFDGGDLEPKCCGKQVGGASFFCSTATYECLKFVRRLRHRRDGHVTEEGGLSVFVWLAVRQLSLRRCTLVDHHCLPSICIVWNRRELCSVIVVDNQQHLLDPIVVD